MRVGVTVCANDGRQRIVLWRAGWWLVEDARTRDVLSGGFKRRAEAGAEAKRLGAA